MDSAQGIIGVMTQAGLEPSADTYTTLLCGYAKKGDIDSINKTLQECETKEIYLLDKDYLDIIYALATNGHAQHVPIILNKVRRAVGYNQDAVNLILRLINKGQEDSAFLVLQSMVRSTKEDGSTIPVGNFFVKQLVKANRPVEKVIELCNKLQENGLYERALSLAAETSLQLGNENLAYPLLQELTKSGISVRPHFFWPLILAKASDPTGRSIVDVLLHMLEFNISPNLETLRDYVIPSLKMKSSDILALLRDANVSIGMAACALVQALLQKNEIQEAALISSKVAAYYNPDVMRRSLTNAFYKTKDVKSYIKLIRNFYDNLDRLSSIRNEEDQEQTPIDKNEVVGNFILDLAINHREFVSNIENVLSALIDEGLSISTSAAEKLQDKLGEKMTENISSMLGKLTSGELTPVPVAKKLPSYTPSHQMNVPQLERLIHNLEAKNQATKGLKRQLITLYYREKDLEKTEALLADLEKDEDFNYTPGFYAQLIDLYAYHDRLDKALFYLNKLKELQNDNFELGESKILRLAQLFVKNNQLEDALKIIETTPKDTKQERSFNYSSQVWRFLNSLAEEGKTEDLNKLFDTLVAKEFIEVNNILLGPLIKTNLVNKDMDKALEKFEWCVTQFKATPWKNELACQLIQAEDAEKLQKLTDLSTAVHGEINSLYDLVFAFVECGRVRQARKILETPGLQNRPQRINTACERYRQEGLVKPLEGLKDATKDLNHIDRGDIYYQLLLSYVKQEDAEKALGLWTQMQEEDLMPSDEFLRALGAFLKQKNYEIPFAIPTESVTNTTEQPKSSVQLFRTKLKSGDIDGALKLRNNLSVTDESLLIEKLLQNDRLGEATKITLALLDKKQMPLNRVFRFLLNKLATAGDVTSLDLIGSKISQDVKKLVSYDNRVCHANLIAGKAEDYLNKLERDIEQAKDEDLVAIGEKFPRGGAYGILERHPELTQKCELIFN